MDILVPSRSSVFRRFERPIFIVGCGNSGTTILWKALQAHPPFSAPPVEGQDLPGLPRGMTHFLGKQTVRLFAHSRFNLAYRLSEANFEGRAAERLASVYAEHLRPGTRFIEKSPANSVRTRFLQQVFPDASFVIVVRNGVAVAEGIRRKRFFDPERPHNAGLQTSIAEGAEHWARTNLVLARDRGYLRRTLVLRYEELVTDTAAVLERVLAFCGIADPVPVPRFDRSLNVQQIARLTAADVAVVKRVAGGVLDVLGYGHTTGIRNKYDIPLRATACVAAAAQPVMGHECEAASGAFCGWTGDRWRSERRAFQARPSSL